jgi:hypothetical protein
MTNGYYAVRFVKRCGHPTGGSTREPIAMWSLGGSMTELKEAGFGFKN